jgi:hypothetical protein
MEAYKISNLFFEEDKMVLILNDQKYVFNLNEISSKLASVDEKERNNFQVSPSGYGIHWPGIEEDLSINGLLNQLKKSRVA